MVKPVYRGLERRRWVKHKGALNEYAPNILNKISYIFTSTKATVVANILHMNVEFCDEWSRNNRIEQFVDVGRTVACQLAELFESELCTSGRVCATLVPHKRFAANNVVLRTCNTARDAPVLVPEDSEGLKKDAFL